MLLIQYFHDSLIELGLPPEEFALEETLTTVPETQIRIERVVVEDLNRITLSVWVRTDNLNAFEAALEDNPTVESVIMLSETDEERLHEMLWTDLIDLISSYSLSIFLGE